jgi:hypothetical protein
MQILRDSDDMDLSFQSCTRMAGEHFDPVEHTTMVQWKNNVPETGRKGIHGQIRKFDEEGGADFIRMRMIETWQAEETMQRGASERGNPTAFLAQAIRRRETARPSMKSV